MCCVGPIMRSPILLFFFGGGVLHVNSKRLCQESIKAFGVGWMKGGRGVSDLGCRKARNQTQYKFLVA